ncbi:MAG: SLC13 family permease [Ardenticatenaceae bacterium]|nr:SLC13 family permease [Ardenticatenaceae bacterium]
MTQSIMVTLAFLLVAVIFFVSERVRGDLVALLVLVSLVLAGLVTPVEALSGFGNPAVVTVGAMFVLSAGLAGTGVVHVIGRQMLRLAGRGEVWLVLGVMGTAVFLSTFMTNIAAATLLLPIVRTAARQAKLPPSKLLLPLAVGCLLGGLLTLVGSPANLLVSDALRQAGLEPFQLFDFAPVGLAVVLAVILFMIVAGRRLLPERYPVQELAGHPFDREEAREFYGLTENLALIMLPDDSPLAGKRLADCRIGQALDLTILGLQRRGRKHMAVEPDTILEGGDQLLVLGRLDRLQEVSERPYFVVGESDQGTMELFSPETGLAELRIHADSPLIGQTIADLDMRRHYHFNVLAIRRQGEIHRTALQRVALGAGDKLLLQGNRAELLAARLQPRFAGGLNVFVAESETAVNYHIYERLLIIHIPANSSLVGQSLAQSHLGELFGLVVLGIIQDEKTSLAPSPDTVLQAGDRLLVEGKPEELTVLRGLQGLVIKRHLQPEQVELESEMAGLVEVVLSPHTTLLNKSLRDLHFRERYGLSVLAIWRNGRIFRSDLANMRLSSGDAFLLYGSREKINLLSRESDFLVLGEEATEAPRRQKASLAVVMTVGVFVAAFIGWLPISIAAVAGAGLMVLSGCLRMEEMYRQIDWRVIFLLAGMLPLSRALQQSGAADYLVGGLTAVADTGGTWGIMIALFALTMAASQYMSNAVVPLLLSPIALAAASRFGISPYALMMIITIAASASFLRPSAHPVNVLVMGPGGYSSQDYLRLGIPLTVITFVVMLIVLPLVWPL